MEKVKAKPNISTRDIKKIYNTKGKVSFFTYNVDGVIFHFTKSIVKDKDGDLEIWDVGTNNTDLPIVKITPNFKNMSLQQIVYAGLTAVKEEIFNRIEMDQNAYRKISQVLGEYSIFGENHE